MNWRQPMYDGPDPTVLIVDDDPQVGTLFATFLEASYDVRLAESGKAALEAMDDDIDIVLLDRRMPGMTGGEVLAHIRDQGYDQPVALVTAVEPDFDILEMGFDDYLVKPVNRDDLLELVENMGFRKQYDEVIREYFSLVSKVTMLEQEKSPQELRESEEYHASTARLDEIKADARAALDVAIEEGKFDELVLGIPDHGDGSTDDFGQSLPDR